MPTLTIELVVAVATFGQARAIAVTVALAAGLLVLAASRRAIRDTTLTGPWAWSLAAVASWGAWECWFAFRPTAAGANSASALALGAISLSLCPAVALLGAKRPQDRAWNFVVLAFWAVLVLPVAETLLLYPGQRPNLGGARGWFLWLPILLGLVNYLPTRFGLAAIAVATGQAIALSPYLALLWRPLVPEPHLAGYALAMAGLCLAWSFRHANEAKSHERNRPWIDFRNAYGLFWALRVQERVNALAAQQSWSVRLGWNGFAPQQDTAATAAAAADQPRSTLRGLLRRFVGPEWLLARTHKRKEEAG